MNWKKVSTILGIIISIGVIAGAGWTFYEKKADRIELSELAGNFQVYKLEQYRRYLNQRIWDLKREFPDRYRDMREYQRLVEELRQIDQKIDAYYRKGGK